MRIVHLSDLHLRHHLPGASAHPERLSRAMPDLFARAVERIASLQPDLFVLSGDLLDYPLDRMDDARLRAQGMQDLALIAGLLRGIPCPMTLVYGNHDHPELFRHVFGPLAQDQRVDGIRVLSFLDDEGPGHVPVRVGDERSRFHAAVANRSARPQIHVQHYVVWPPRNESYPHTYGDGEDMRDAIVANGAVRLVLSGHYHAGVEPFAEANAWFATVPAFCEAPHPFWVYDLNGCELWPGRSTRSPSPDHHV